MTILRWNFLNLILAIVMGAISFSAETAAFGRPAQALFLVFIVLFLLGLGLNSFHHTNFRR